MSLVGELGASRGGEIREGVITIDVAIRLQRTILLLRGEKSTVHVLGPWQTSCPMPNICGCPDQYRYYGPDSHRQGMKSSGCFFPTSAANKLSCIYRDPV